MLVRDICEKYASSYESYRADREKVEAQIDRLQAKTARLQAKFDSPTMPYWLDSIVRPIADELAKSLPGYTMEILGPFGICCEAPVHFYKQGVAENERFNDGNCKSICFVPGELDKGEILVRDRSVDTGKFKPGTIGELNGMNHPSVEIPDGADVSWLLQYVR